MRRINGANQDSKLSVEPMVKVPSPTSKYGYHTFSKREVWEWRPNGSNSWLNFTSDTVFAASNRPSPVKGNPPLATNYHRKLLYLTSLAAPDVRTSSHEVKGGSSLHSRGVVPDTRPYGSHYGSPDVIVPSWMTDQCIQGCMEALIDLRANVLEDAGQAKQTVEMMGSIVVTIVELFLMAWKRQWKALRRRLRKWGKPKSVANGWLMYYYGIRPLVSTLQALSEEYQPRLKLKTVTRKVDDPVDPLGFIYNPTVRDVIGSGKAERGVKVGMTVAVNLSANMSMFTSLGLASPMSDSVATAWALVPYSFVVDWILPMERYLRTRSWQSGFAYKSGYVDKRLWCDATFTTLNPMTGSGDGGILPKASLKALQLQRIAYNSFTPPSGLSFKLSLNPTQSVNAIALAIQRM